jgi:uncharacterized protein involved in cysteine biosynthesis
VGVFIFAPTVPKGGSISLPWFGEIAWLSTILSGFLLISVLIGSVFLMFPVASLLTGLFLDQVVDAVDVEHFGS